MIWSMCLSIISSTWFTSTYSKHVHIFFRRSTSSIYNCSHRSRSLTLARWYSWNKNTCVINLFQCLTSILHNCNKSIRNRSKHLWVAVTFLKNKANDPVFLGLAFVVSFLSSFAPEWIIVWTGINIYNGKKDVSINANLLVNTSLNKMVNQNCIYLSPVICLCLLEGNNLGGLCRWTTAVCWGILCWWHRRFLWLGQYTKKTPLGTSWRGGAKAVSGRHTGRWGHQHICNNNAH